MRIGRRHAALTALAVTALVPAGAQAAVRTLSVQVGGQVRGLASGDLDGNYPNVTTIHVGDRVRFNFAGFHSVTFPAKGHTTPPLIVPAGGLFPPQNDAGGAPFWWSNLVGRLQGNIAAVAKSSSNNVNGSTLVNSGLPQSGPPIFVARFSKAGTYSYFCVLHPYMKGTIRVLAKGRKVPTKLALARRARAEIATDSASARQLFALTKDITSGNDQTLGVFVGQGTKRFSLLGFWPAAAHVKVGQTLTFKFRGPNEAHTVSFGPAAYLGPLADSLLGGPTTTLVNPIGFLPSDPPAAGVPSLTATTHGNGFVNSGVIFDAPAPTSHPFSVKFTQPGTFHYICLIHPFMAGTVTVTP